MTVEQERMHATEASTRHENANDTAPAADERSDGAHRGGWLSAGDDLLERARQEDAQHWELHERPISAETLHKRLRVSATRSRMLVAKVRSTDT